MSDYRVGDRVRHKTTGQEWVLRPDGWEEVLVGNREVLGLNLDAAGMNLFDKGVQNLLNTPAVVEAGVDALSRGVATGAAGTANVMGNIATGRPANWRDEFSSAQQRFADSTEQTIPRFGDLRNFGEDIRTAADAVTSDSWKTATLPDAMSEARERQQLRMQQAQELYPRASAVGDFGADIGALLLNRRPVARMRQERAIVNQARAERFLEGWRGTRLQMDPKIQSALDDAGTKAWNKIQRGSQSLASAGVKAGEAGLEGAYLAALNSDDPVVSAAFSAGTQAAGSLGLWLSTNPRTALLPFVASAFATHEVWKVFAPGPTSFFESEDFAFRAAAAALSLGWLGAMAGSGRLGPSYIKWPQFADAVTSVPRAGTQALWREFRDNTDDGNPVPQMVFAHIGRGGELFNANQMRSLQRAYEAGARENNPRKNAFSKEVARLMRDSKAFRDSVATLQQRMTPPANADLVSQGGTPYERMLRNSRTYPIIRE